MSFYHHSCPGLSMEVVSFLLYNDPCCGFTSLGLMEGESTNHLYRKCLDNVKQVPTTADTASMLLFCSKVFHVSPSCL